MGGQTTYGLNAYVVSRVTGVVTLLSDPIRGGSAPAISGDGAFVTHASGSDVYLWRRGGGTHRLTHGNASSVTPAISSDGSTVGFTSSASDLSPADTNGNAALFRWDRSTATVTRLTDADSPFTSLPSVSAGGTHIAFSSTAGNVVAGDGPGTGDVFVWDRSGGMMGSNWAV